MAFKFYEMDPMVKFSQCRKATRHDFETFETFKKVRKSLFEKYGKYLLTLMPWIQTSH